MRPNHRWLLQLPLAFCVLAAATSASAQIHRCQMAEGKVVYSDAACPSGTEKAGTVQGTARTAASEAERRQAMAAEREVLALQQERLALQRERIQVERERVTLRRDSAQTEREVQLPAGYGATIPIGIHSYSCEIATRNLGVGGSAYSRARSQREYEMACFGEQRAADIAVQRAGLGSYGYGYAGATAPGCRSTAHGTLLCN